MRYVTRLVLVSLLFAASLLVAAEMPDFKKIIERQRISEMNRWKQASELRAETDRPMDYYDTHGMTIDITLDFETETFNAICTLEIESLEDNLDHFSFDYDNSYYVQSIKLDGVNLEWVPEDTVVSAFFNESVQAGEIFTIEVEYFSLPENRLEDGLKFEYHAGVPVAFTMCSPRGARKWIPCNDTPADKIDTVDLYISYPTEYLSASNGILQETIDNGDGTKTDHWHESHPVTSYLISLAVTNYEISSFTFEWEGQTMPVDNYVYPEQYDVAVNLFNQSADMLAFYSSIYGPYPFLDEKYGHAVCTSLGATAMEHQTCTSYNAGSIGADDASYTVAHELSHQWGGDCISINGWYDVWLKEGFATYSEALWAEYQFSTEGLIQYMEDLDSGSQLDPCIYRDPEGSANEIFNWVVYAKGAWVMHMLRGVIGDDNFFQTLSGILADPEYRYGNYNTDQFRDYAEEVSGMDLDWFFDCWYWNEGRPRYSYTIYCSEDSDDAILGIFSEGTAGADFDMMIPYECNGAVSSIFVPAGMGHYTLLGTNSTYDIVMDPYSFVLDAGFALQQPTLSEIPQRDGKVGLVWEPFFDEEIEGYHIYRSENGDEFIRITDEPLDATSWLDENLNTESEYSYKISAVYQGYQSNFSNTIVTQPIDYSLDMGIMIVDNSMDYNTGTLPTDEEMDAFYDDLMLHYNYTAWDVSDQGYPPLSEMGKYSTVIWHADDIQQMPLVDDIYRLQNYTLAGGNLLISQCKKTSAMQPAILDQFFEITGVTYNNQPDFIGAISADTSEFPNIPIDPDRLPLPNWTDAMGYVSRFEIDESVEVLYTYDSISDDPDWEGQPCAFRLQNPNIILLGFPLYHMMAAEAQTFMQDVLHAFGELDPAVDDPTAPQYSTDVTLYPNPFNPELNIRLSMEKPGLTEIRIYNVRGELVRSYEPEMLDAGIYTRVWDGCNQQGNPVSSGIYMVRTNHADKVSVTRAALIK